MESVSLVTTGQASCSEILACSELGVLVKWNCFQSGLSRAISNFFLTLGCGQYGKILQRAATTLLHDLRRPFLLSRQDLPIYLPCLSFLEATSAVQLRLCSSKNHCFQNKGVQSGKGLPLILNAGLPAVEGLGRASPQDRVHIWGKGGAEPPSHGPISCPRCHDVGYCVPSIDCLGGMAYGMESFLCWARKASESAAWKFQCLETDKT